VSKACSQGSRGFGHFQVYIRVAPSQRITRNSSSSAALVRMAKSPPEKSASIAVLMFNP